MADKTSYKPTSGKMKVIYTRELGDTAAPVRLPFQTSHSFNPKKKSDSTATKDGSVAVSGALDRSFELQALSSAHPAFALFTKSMEEDVMLEGWEVDFSTPGTGENAGKFASTYFQYSVNEIKEDNDADDFSQKDITSDVYLNPQSGFATVSNDETNAVQYAFKDMGLASN